MAEDSKFRGWKAGGNPSGRRFSLFQDVIASPTGKHGRASRDYPYWGSGARGVETMPGFSAGSMRLSSSRSPTACVVSGMRDSANGSRGDFERASARAIH